jgi:hypothetical protein
VIGSEIIKGHVIVTLPGVVLVMITQEFIEALRRSMAEARHELAVRERDMAHHARLAKRRAEPTEAALASAEGELQALVGEAEGGCAQILACHNVKAAIVL